MLPHLMSAAQSVKSCAKRHIAGCKRITHDLQPRFDVIEVYLTNDRRVFVRYLAGAFEGKEE